MVSNSTKIKLADQIWVATALLHRQQPEQDGFTVEEIVEQVRQEFHQVQPGVKTHLYQHMVATKAPNPGRHRMLSQEDGKLRLFRPGDPYHPDREGGKICPKREDLPGKYHDLLRWYEEEYAPGFPPFTLDHPLFKLVGVGASGCRDTGERHDEALAEIYYAEFHYDSPQSAKP